MKITVITITYNSEKFLQRCLEHVRMQSYPASQVLVVDNNSDNKDFLRKTIRESDLPVHLIELDLNIGYPGGCNAATSHISPQTDFVLYVGPDTYLQKDYIKEAVDYLSAPMNHNVAAVSGKLLGFDNDKVQPTGFIDSTGVEQTWYGRWYDRHQRTPDSEESNRAKINVLALCGTALFCRFSALQVLCTKDPYSIYDAAFFLYKEDIDLSLRLRKSGFDLHYCYRMLAYHCRGWNRSTMSNRAKVLSARNEIIINSRRGFVKFLYSILKVYWVTRFN